MLVLSRRLNEKILFPGINAAVQVVAIKGGAVRIGIEAPPEVAVVREEVQPWERPPCRSGATGALRPVSRAPQRALPTEPKRRLNAEPDSVPHILRRRLRVASTALGLARLQLQTGQTLEARALLDRVQRDLQLLRQRLEGRHKSRGVDSSLVSSRLKSKPQASTHARSPVLANCLGAS